MVKPKALYYKLITTGWGQVAAVWSDGGLWELGFPRPDGKTALADIRAQNIVKLDKGNDAWLWSEQLAQELGTYFRGFSGNFHRAD